MDIRTSRLKPSKASIRMTFNTAASEAEVRGLRAVHVCM